MRRLTVTTATLAGRSSPLLKAAQRAVTPTSATAAATASPILTSTRNMSSSTVATAAAVGQRLSRHSSPVSPISRISTNISTAASSMRYLTSASTPTSASVAAAVDTMIDTAPSSAQTLRILLTGAPGAGKGTQAERIAKALDIVTISSGQLLRTHIAENTEIGALAKVAVEKGELISDDIMVSMIQDEIRRVSGRNWLLDGFPRTVGQAQLLEQVIAQDPTLESVNLVVNLVVPEEVIIERITERYVHIPSGRTYHTVYSPPKVAMIDDVTGEPLTKRSDDTVEVVQKRLDTYHKMTRPVLDYYREKDIVVDFYGETSDVIFPQIMDHLAGNFEEAMSKQIEARL